MFFSLASYLYWSIAISNAVLVSGVQQSDSATHIHIPILFQIISPFWCFYT